MEQQPEHIRLKAMKKMCELLEDTLGVKVYRGRQVVGKDIALPFLVINEAVRSGNTKQTASRTTRNDRVDFLLSGYVENEKVTHPIDDLYKHIYKVEQAFNKIHAMDKNGKPEFKEWFSLGGLVNNFNYEAPVCHNPADDVQSKSYFYFYFSYDVAYHNADPSGASLK